MPFRTHHLTHGTTLVLRIDNDSEVSIVYGEGGGCTLDVIGPVAGVWVTLRGALRVIRTFATCKVGARRVFVNDPGTHLKVIARGNTSRWLAVLGPTRAWKQLRTGTVVDPVLVPAKHLADHSLLRNVITLVRADDSVNQECAAVTFADAIAELQAPLHATINRCPGRTRSQKYQVFERLQRVRNFIESRCGEGINNHDLARIANYSTHHFLRTYKRVYCETPHTYLVHQRLRMAEQLMSQSELSITEIALACGFESSSAFSRLFHQRLGKTARDIRRNHLLHATC